MTIAPTYLMLDNGISFLWPIERPHFAEVTRVVDGDTIRCDIDMDLKAALRDYPVRMTGRNAWEQSTAAGQAAKANLSDRLPVGTQIVLTTIKDYKYGGEFVAKVWLLDGTDLIADLIADQWLAEWDGRGRAADHVPPWPRTGGS